MSTHQSLFQNNINERIDIKRENKEIRRSMKWAVCPQKRDGHQLCTRHTG